MNIYIPKNDAGGRGLIAGGAAAARVPALPCILIEQNA